MSELFTKEQRQIYQSRVLIPISITSKTHAMLGPPSDLTIDPEKLKQFFPTYCRYKPITNTRKPRACDEIHTDENPHPDQ